MKQEKIWVYAAAVLVLGFALSGCAVRQSTHRLRTEECFGIWVNCTYNSEDKRAAKIIYNPDMTWTAYKTDSSFQPRWRGTISIIEKWHDKQGNVWYKITTNQLGIDIIVYELWKINKSATIIEGTWGAACIPKEIDPSSESYTIYYRYTSSSQAKISGKNILDDNV